MCVIKEVKAKGQVVKSCLSLSQRWSAMTLQNETLVLDSSSTTTRSDGMNLVLRQGVLRHGDSYIFTLHVSDHNLDGEGAASITLHHNMPPAGGECHLRGGGETGTEHGVGDGEGWSIRTLMDRVHFNCSGRKKEGVFSLSYANHYDCNIMCWTIIYRAALLPHSLCSYFRINLLVSSNQTEFSGSSDFPFTGDPWFLARESEAAKGFQNKSEG